MPPLSLPHNRTSQSSEPPTQMSQISSTHIAWLVLTIGAVHPLVMNLDPPFPHTGNTLGILCSFSIAQWALLLGIDRLRHDLLPVPIDNHFYRWHVWNSPLSNRTQGLPRDPGHQHQQLFIIDHLQLQKLLGRHYKLNWSRIHFGPSFRSGAAVHLNC